MTFDRVMVGSEFDYFQPTQSGYLVRCVKVGNSRYKVLGSLAYAVRRVCEMKVYNWERLKPK